MALRSSNEACYSSWDLFPVYGCPTFILTESFGKLTSLQWFYLLQLVMVGQFANDLQNFITALQCVKTVTSTHSPQRLLIISYK